MSVAVQVDVSLVCGQGEKAKLQELWIGKGTQIQLKSGDVLDCSELLKVNCAAELLLVCLVRLTVNSC